MEWERLEIFSWKLEMFLFMIGSFIILFHFHLSIEDVSQTCSIMNPLT